jgi:RND family efflux transporter MFP subunit
MNKGKTLRKALLVAVSLGALVLILAYMSGTFRDRIEPAKLETSRRLKGSEPTYEVEKVIQRERIEVVGTLRAEHRTEIAARVVAAIVSMGVRAGDRVNKGDVLVRLDNRDLRANLEQARHAVVAAEVNMKNAERNYERFKNLKERHVASTREYDDAKAQYEASEAQLEQAREAVAAAEAMLSYTVIRAPISGIVVDKLMDVGDTTQPGRPILSIYDPSLLRLEAAVPESMAAGLKKGDRIPFVIDALQGSEEEPIEGPIEEIVPEADAASRSVLVKVGLPPDTPRAIEGSFGRMLIPSRDRVRLCVAQSAVKRVGQLTFVDVVKDDGLLERRQVKLGEESPYGRVEALSGLNGGETVVLHGPPPQPLPEGVKPFPKEETR